MFPNSYSFKSLKRNVSIATVLADKGLLARFAKRNDTLSGPCPLHGGDNPHALVINLTKNIWHCFTGCDTGGDLIDFVQRLDNLPYRQTGRYLSALAGMVPAYSSVKPRLKKHFRPFTTRLCLNPYTDWLRHKGIHPRTAMRFEAGAYQGPGFLENCVGVRLHDPAGHPLGYAGRRLDPQESKTYGKWKFPSSLPKSSLLYNYHRLPGRNLKHLVVVECPWGVMRLSQVGLPAVSLLGTSASPAQVELLRSAELLILMMDGDLAGRRADDKLRNLLGPQLPVRSFSLPQGYDPDDLTDSQLKEVANLFLS